MNIYKLLIRAVFRYFNCINNSHISVWVKKSYNMDAYFIIPFYLHSFCIIIILKNCVVYLQTFST